MSEVVHAPEDAWQLAVWQQDECMAYDGVGAPVRGWDAVSSCPLVFLSSHGSCLEQHALLSSPVSTINQYLRRLSLGECGVGVCSRVLLECRRRKRRRPGIVERWDWGDIPKQLGLIDFF
ncbi:hypothetical protein GOP47_0013927 [Adiantum capillus-veneris]|uniref:Uncharacterized protein n=1 Tax=Adiantum capillus-veneris TaxID=13818 RepID=A0A9D4UPN6_ADICA|nr:hypothetical protein GOP47_0013927 [Adiantum capillus-veneris]